MFSFLRGRRRFIHDLLRGYQRECIEKSIEAFNQGIKRQAVSLPVGSGKTVIFSNLIRELITPTRKKALVLAHREELLLQACRQIEKWCPGAKVALDQGSNEADPESADVIVASVPTLGRINSEERRSKYDQAAFQCIIVDEAHHAAAPSYQRIFEHFKGNTDMLLWGCSATLSRNDDLALSSVFDKVVFHIDMKRMMDEGWLCPAQVFQIETDVDLTGVRMNETFYGGKDFNFGELCLAVNTPERNKLVVDTWKRFALGEHQRCSTIVFGLGVDHVESLQREFARIGVRAECITGSTPDAIRTSYLEEFSRGALPVLINCAVLTEGTDLPITDCILLTRPTCNPNLYIQMVGRGLRRHSSKTYCLVLDVVDKYRGRKNRSLITFPTLEASTEPKRPKNENEEEKEEVVREREEPTELSQIERIRVNLRRMTDQSVIPDLQLHRLSWVKLDDRHYLCSGKEHEFLLEIQDLQHPSLPSIITLPKLKTVIHSGPLHESLEGFANYLKEGNLLKDFLSNSYWRKRYPMTEGQHRILKSLAERLGAYYEEFAQTRKWNVGQACNIISRYFGARKYLGKETIKTWPQLVQDVFFESFYHPQRRQPNKNV